MAGQGKMVMIGCVGGFTAWLYYYDLLFSCVLLCLHLLVIVAGVYLGASWTLVKGKTYKPSTPPPDPAVTRELLEKLMELQAEKKSKPKKVVISRNIDLAIQEVMDFVVRDFILTWYKDLSRDQDTFVNAVRSDMWELVENVSSRLTKVDKMKFITSDVIHKIHTHFTDIRHATKRDSSDVSRKFILQPWLENEEKEIAFLRKLCEALLLVLLPKHYKGCTVFRQILREILTSSVLKPTIDLICDPDYINKKLISYIDYRHQLSEDTRRTYTYAATYEDFIKMIDKCDDIEHLKQIRYNIMTEIIQATTIDNIKKEQGTDSAKEGSPKGKAKGDLLKARNLKRYINQLKIAKSKCEKRIHSMGGPDYKYYECDDAQSTPSIPGQKVLSFVEIMDSPSARDEFKRFLQRDDNESLLGFWDSVEKLKNIDKRQQHQKASEIYHQYISSTTSVVKLDKPVLKGMESFMLANAGPDAFYEGQEQIFNILQKHHYPSFLVSDIYHRYIMNIEGGKSDSLTNSDKLFFEPYEDGFAPLEDEEEGSDFMFAGQSYEAEQKLQQLNDKIRNKTQALEALRNSTKVEKVQKELEREIELLKSERNHLEGHILRTHMWCENQGKWRTQVYEAEVVEEGDKKVPMFALIVHKQENLGTKHNVENRHDNSSNGWVVSRSIPDFHNVHEKLVQIAGPWLRKKELPNLGRFTTVDDKFVNESKKILNEYLEAVMKDERMAQSEALYGFLTPTPEYFKQRPLEKKSKFFLTNLLKSLPTIRQEAHDSDDELVFSVDDGSKLDASKDSIAEPFYDLANEVFELRGMFKWLRKSFIMFVEVTFGRSINKQLRETVDWIFSESMVIYYIRLFKDSQWPDGKLAESLPSQSDEEKMKTRMEAKEKFLQNLPDAVRVLVGEDNARRGAIKTFEVLQDTRLNKHLLYIIIELLLFELCPELKPEKDTTAEASAE